MDRLTGTPRPSGSYHRAENVATTARGSTVSSDQPYVALPKLYGAPAYARPPKVIEMAPRPFDPDELPIEALMDDVERSFASRLPARAYAPGGTHLERRPVRRGPTANELRPRAFDLKSIAGRLVGAGRPRG
jgi:hypothetical protein